ncbi:MAG: polysaccharide deacetylase family protein [Bacteroidaceae bacterium]
MKRPAYILLLLLIITGQGILAGKHNHMIIHKGGIVRADTTRRQLTLVFTAADRNDGVEQILSTLKVHHIKAAFFLTGSFIEKFPEDVARIRQQGHYVGSHSYSHPLYSTWENPDSTIITQDFFEQDIFRSYQALAPYGITPRNAPYFMPPYEHYNATIAEWAKSMGLTLVNFTSGTASNADYTTPSMKNYRSSENILQTILKKEESEGLNGHLMLFHAGTSPERTDKFYVEHLNTLIQELQHRGYRFVSLTKALR